MDEVNLLDDGLVDVVLDSSASGVNTVEREGIGIVHPAKFIMIGSGNPQVRVTPSPGTLRRALCPSHFLQPDDSRANSQCEHCTVRALGC